MYDVEDFGAIIYEQMLENERTGKAVGVFQKLFGGKVGEVVLGEREYVVLENTVVETGQEVMNGEIVGVNMLQDRGAAPELQPSDKVWQGMERAAQALRDGVDATVEAAPLFAPYDMSRLASTEERIQSTYIATAVEIAQEVDSIREPPKWLLGTLKKSGFRSFKIGTRDNERYKDMGYTLEDYSRFDMVLSSNVTAYGVGVFLNPAYYRQTRQLDIYEDVRAGVYEMNYFLKNKYQRRYLTRSPTTSYVPSKFGHDTLVARPYIVPSVEGDFKEAGTDFFFRVPSLFGHLSYFQHLPGVTVSRAQVYRKSTIYGVYKRVLKGVYSFATDVPIPNRIMFDRGRPCVGDGPVRYGNRFLYILRRVMATEKPDRYIFKERDKYRNIRHSTQAVSELAVASQWVADYGDESEEEAPDVLNDEDERRREVMADFEDRYQEDEPPATFFVADIELFASAALAPQMLVVNEDLKKDLDPWEEFVDSV